MSSELKPASQDPSSAWTYTWESQSHNPTLRLHIFHSEINPKLQCNGLQIRSVLEQSVVLVNWVDESESKISIRVPIPRRVLIDVEVPLGFKAADDHIEVKLVLLLPVDHPIVLGFDENEDSDELQPLVMDSDLSSLSSGEGVDFYCRNCSYKLTTNPISFFVEMPSVDWRESADNWFGGCCCSFGGVSEKIVTGYANSYSCTKGTCLVNLTSVVVCKDDTMQCLVLNKGISGKDGSGVDANGDEMSPKNQYTGDQTVTLNHLNGKLSSLSVVGNVSAKESTELVGVQSSHSLQSGDHTVADEFHTDSSCCTSESCATSQLLNEVLKDDQKFLLNGFLENIFMVRSSYLSKNVEWVECLCPSCSSLLGAYPSSASGNGPLDGGIRFFKCCISTCPVPNDPLNLFRKYTMERMFTHQLLESANDELMFHTLVKDLKTKAPALQIAILNPNSWSCTGYSDTTKQASNAALRPVMKVLFSHSSNATCPELSMREDWVRKNDADEVYMFTEQIKDLIDFLEAGKSLLPASLAHLQDLPLSSLHR